MGLHPSEIIIGYTKAINKTVVILEELVEEGSESMNVRDKDDVISRMRSAVASKQFGQEHILCPLIAEACIQVCPKNPVNFNVDNVRVAKLLGGGLHDSVVVRGMVLKSDAVGTIKRVEKAKASFGFNERTGIERVAVFVGGFIDQLQEIAKENRSSFIMLKAGTRHDGEYTRLPHYSHLENNSGLLTASPHMIVLEEFDRAAEKAQKFII
ncbi:UNVERIFIED_CONTAM: T-complex protein 1 subunit theta [Sesamum calycinum]|uniref:T-complex protein 1 subunit theta n=1 Tax=Sesamum calycinum TaxID=2727403 RepID=A0AAW2JC74_9LAMI